MNQSPISRARAVLVNRGVAGAAVSMAFATYFTQPVTFVAYAVDFVVRAYLHFIAGVMAHESVHGHLGNTRSANRWWGRLALFPTTVPYVTFRTTHLHHHANTNVPELDPDEFLNTRHAWQIPIRAFALPYHWVVWMWKTGRFTRTVRREYLLNYLAAAVVYGVIAYFTSVQRVVLGFLASATLHALFLWYYFAIKTHAGYSTAAMETRSHNYDGALLYWLSFGLSLHRVHHMTPRLAWLQTHGLWESRSVDGKA